MYVRKCVIKPSGIYPCRVGVVYHCLSFWAVSIPLDWTVGLDLTTELTFNLHMSIKLYRRLVWECYS